MKSCLSISFLILFLLISVPLSWWYYNDYTYRLDCEYCKKNLNKYYFHFDDWQFDNNNRYFVLDCFCDAKEVLKKINKFRKTTMLTNKNKNSVFMKDDFFESGSKWQHPGSSDDLDWDNISFNVVVAKFTRDTTNWERLSYLWFGLKNDTLHDKKVQRKELSKSWGRVTYSVDYDELNRSVLNQFAQTVYKDSTRFAYNTCVYSLYNRQAKKVEATMKYEDKGKGFYFEIW